MDAACVMHEHNSAVQMGFVGMTRLPNSDTCFVDDAIGGQKTTNGDHEVATSLRRVKGTSGENRLRPITAQVNAVMAITRRQIH
jgi:hypothetical protein